MSEEVQSYKTEAAQRTKVIVHTSVIGIGANVLLALVKAITGLATGSIAVLLDAVNNLSDALSSVITILGTMLAGRKPDRKHPMGYGRVEYLSAVIVSALVLYAGLTSLVESVKKIIHPEDAAYTTLSLVLIALAVIVKFFLGKYVMAKGKAVNSASLTASGSDARFDSLVSLSVLVSALVFQFFHIRTEAYVGALIAVLIIRSGIEMLKDTLDDILGKRPSIELTRELKTAIAKDPAVHGAYDLVLDNYGPDVTYGSVHVEVDDTMTAAEIDEMTRRIEDTIYQQFKVILTGIGIYSRNTTDQYAEQIRENIRRIAMSHEGVLSTHGFYLNEKEKKLSVDILIGFGDFDRMALYQQVVQEIQTAYPDYKIVTTMDSDISEE